MKKTSTVYTLYIAQILHDNADLTAQVYRAHIRESEHVLLDMPVAIASFRMKDQREPYLVVAAGTTLYIYRLMSPFYKLTIPSEKVDPREKAIWCDQCFLFSRIID